MICGKYLKQIWLISKIPKRSKQRLTGDQGCAFCYTTVKIVQYAATFHQIEMQTWVNRSPRFWGFCQ